ncbi:hypothetical protein BH24ACT3_BH24ACT3_10120 [soil metagenome]
MTPKRSPPPPKRWPARRAENDERVPLPAGDDTLSMNRRSDQVFTGVRVGLLAVPSAEPRLEVESFSE